MEVRLSVGGQTPSKSRAGKTEPPQVTVVHKVSLRDMGFISSAGKVTASENMEPEFQEPLDPRELLTSS